MGGKNHHTMISHFALCFLLCICITIIPQIVAINYPLNVWPKPRTFQWSNPMVVPLSPNFTITFPEHQYLTPAVRRYLRHFLTENHHPLVPPAINVTSSSPLTSLTITISNIAMPLMHGVNESYALSISAQSNSTTGTLTAQTVWGAMRGLETLSQLMYGNPTLVAAGVYIFEDPIFQHRGVMLDTSRNYYEVEHLLRLISAMSMNKLNVFHWHITDSHSFPLVLPSEPELASKGAYGDDMKYTPEDVKIIVQYGMEHGVRVVPEIDMPAHTGSWAGAYPDIVTCENMFWFPAGAEWPDRLAAEPGTGQLNPLNPLTYEVAKNVITEVASMFPDSFFHAGADEVTPNCWKKDPQIQSFLSKNGTLSQLLETFVNSTLPYIVSLNKTIVYWEDVLLDGEIRVQDATILPTENVILQTWNNGPSNTKIIVDSGYQVIVSSSGYYYLDCGHGEFLGNDSQYNQPQIPGNDTNSGGSWCGPFKTWQTIYNYDITEGLNDFEAKLVLGGEVALWSEQADGTVLDSRVWPRTCAMAETLWSGNRDENGVKRYAEATDRLNEWRYRMVKRGIGAEPIQPLWCVRNKGMCNTVN